MSGRRFRNLMILGVGLSAAVAPAAPIEYVKVSTVIAPGSPIFTYSSTTGLTSQGGILPGSVVSPSASANTNLLNQTNAWVAQDGVIQNGVQTFNAQGYASVDLASGKLGVLASAHSPGEPQPNGRDDSSAVMRDLVSFNNTTGAAVPIDVYFGIEGSMNIGPVGTAFLFSRFCFGANCSLAGNSLLSNVFEYYFTENSAFAPDGNYVTLPSTGWVSRSFTPGNNPTASVFHGVYLVPAGSSSAELYASLSLHCGFDSACDYTNTAALSLNLPSGVTYTSDSGVLLSAAGSAVPEPRSWALVALGVGILATIRRRTMCQR